MIIQPVPYLVRPILLFIAFFVSLFSMPAVSETASVADLLRGMSVALRSTNYQGTFTYEHSGALETFSVAHVVIDKQEYERLHYLSGPEREVVREARQRDCLGVGDLILRGQLGNLFKQYPGLGEYYDIAVRGEDRVAGRDAVVLHIAPKDDYRFGQSLSLDAETLLPLRVLVLNKMQVLERFQFVELEVGDSVSAGAADPTIDNFLPIAKGLNCDKTLPAHTTRWKFDWVPKGFAMVGARITKARGEMIMFADGISSFSIFVEPAKNGQGLEALRGATVVYMVPLVAGETTYRATLVGEVPLLSAKRVVAAMRLDPEEVSGSESLPSGEISAGAAE